jgi:hypothetical protein
MATKIVHSREKSKKASIDELNAHINYCKDTKHPDHKGLILHPAKNYNCGGQTDADFVAAVEGTQKKYLEVRDGLSGKRTADIWEEAINNMDEKCYHTPAERDEIEKNMIARICPNSPARAQWHENPETGEVDLHIIFSTKNLEGTLTLASITTHKLVLRRELDQMAADVLNNAINKPKKRKKHIPTARETEKKKSKAIAKKAKKPEPCPLEMQIARLAEEDGIEEVQAHHLRDLLKRLGIIIEKFVGKTIHVIYSRKRQVKKPSDGSKAIYVPRTGIHVVDDLLDKVFKMQIQLRREKSTEKSRDTSPEQSQDKSQGITDNVEKKTTTIE